MKKLWLLVLLLPACGSDTMVVRTRAATFLVRPAMADPLSRLLAGEPTEHLFYAGSEPD